MHEATVSKILKEKIYGSSYAEMKQYGGCHVGFAGDNVNNINRKVVKIC